MTSAQDHFTAFAGRRRLASGPLAEVALAVKAAQRPDQSPIAIFSDATGKPIDLDLRGSDADMMARLSPIAEPASRDAVAERRGRGRPKLGVVAREVTLLPRHWDWLGAQPGGASVALRKLVEAARRERGDSDRAARADFEEAARALFADDRRKFAAMIAGWPADVRDHIVKLAFSDRADDRAVA